jgi:DNA-binding MarR family transcriptional regulator
MRQDLRRLREALLDLSGILNRPQPDAALIALAGVDLDRALFPLLARAARRERLGIGELAQLCGRDYSTVSRQITKLQDLRLVERRVNSQDARISEVIVTPEGRKMIRSLDGARARLLRSLFADWDKREVAELARLLRRFADDAMEFVRSPKARPAKRVPER